MAAIEKQPRMIRLMTASLLLATFVAGTVTGGVLVHGFSAHSEPAPHFPRLSGPWSELDLSNVQREKVHTILERHRPELDAILTETFPKVRKVNEQIDQEVREILTEGQRKQFDQVKAEHRHGPPPPPPGPPGNWPREGAPGPIDGPLGMVPRGGPPPGPPPPPRAP